MNSSHRAPPILANPFLSETGQDASTTPAASVCDEMSFRSRKLSDLVSENDVSVRLANCFANAEKHGGLPFTTVGEYLDAGDGASVILCSEIRNFGAKTARELAALVSEERVRVPRLKPSKAADLGSGSIDAKRAELIDRFGNINVETFIAGEQLSVRLSTVLARSGLRNKPVKELFDGHSFKMSSLLRFKNLGRKSADEFKLLFARLVARQFHEWGFDASACEAAAQLLLGHWDATQLVSEAFHAETLNFEKPVHESLRERIDWLLSELEPKSADIVRRRFGIGRTFAETLEEIGVAFSVTRERIRQIESKSLRRIRHLLRRSPIDELLAAEAPAIWTDLSKGSSTLLRGEIHEAKQCVDPYVILALAALELSLAHWLDSIAMSLPAGWAMSDVDRETIEGAASSLSKHLDNKLLPRAVTGIDPSIDGATAEIACRLVLGLTVKNGYVLPVRAGVRLSRAAGLHAALAARGNVVDLLELLSDYHSRFPSDPCTARDAEIVMEAASHLFLELEERRWLALGAAGVAPTCQTLNMPAPPIEEPGTIAYALQAALRLQGPTRLGDLLDDASKILPDGRSINSIGPVLLTRHDLFIRLLPGVYGLPEHLALGDALPESAPWLFNDHQARLFCLARFAGEPWGAFPFWNPRTEYRFCLWARHSGGSGTLNSLMAVAEVSNWPVLASEKEQWLILKKQIGRFEFGNTLRTNAAYDRPDLDRVLAACVYARAVGSLNWIAANRVCGDRIDAHRGAGMVALLVQLGVLTESETGFFAWQRAHQTSPTVDDIIGPLVKELATMGSLDWNTTIGRGLAEKALTAGARPGSWIDAPEVTAMFDGLNHKHPVLDEDVDPVEAILAQHRRKRDAERREARLKWLLAEET